MGLDMYLTGEAFYTHSHPNRAAKPFPIKEMHLEIKYWRKHPNLHGYIVQTFADGVDNCEPINLSKDYLVKLIAGIEAQSLPHTTGFFFGASDCTPEEKAEDLAAFKAALEWLETEDKDVWKSVVYRASW